MGAGLSGFINGLTESGEAGPAPSGSGLGDMPELCVAEMMLHLEATEICRLAKLNRAFRGAADADFVWERKLPPNYEYLMGFVFHDGGEERKRQKMTKKEVYARLSRPVAIDGGTKEFWLEKRKGGLCVALSAKALKITGIDDRRYWMHMPTAESRFNSVAYLQQIWWFEVVGELDFCFPAGSYSLYFRLHLGRAQKRFGHRICNTDNIHGWAVKPVRFQLSTSDGQHAKSQCHLDEPGSWILYHVGDFVVQKSDQSMSLRFSMAQIDCTHTKGGLCVDSVMIYPKGYRDGKVVKPRD